MRTYLVSTFVCFVFLASSAVIADPIKVTKLRPDKDCGGFFVRLVAGIRTPHVYEVELDSKLVDSILPNKLEPRLQRDEPGIMGKISDAARSPKLIQKFKDEIREKSQLVPVNGPEGLAALFPERQTHTFTVTGTHFSFAPTGPAKSIDQVTKHVVISHDLNDVRFAGQTWREGNTLCYSGNSGTFMKKRDQNPARKYNEAPEPELLVNVLAPIFGTALAIKHCDRIAPGFGGSEALDQAEKAVAAAEAAEQAAKVARIPERAAKARIAARGALAAADEAEQLAKAAEDAEAMLKKAMDKQDPELEGLARADLQTADERAAEGAEKAKDARKKAEKALKNIDKPLKD